MLDRLKGLAEGRLWVTYGQLRYWLRLLRDDWRRESALTAVSALHHELWTATGRYADPRSLSRFDVSVYSGGGEDGMIAEIFRRIGLRSRVFVEIGIDGGKECNTRLLLEQGWRGLWLVGGTAEAEAARHRFVREISEGRLTVRQAFVTPETISSLIEEGGIPEGFDLLSLDVDQHTSHLWRAMRQRARVTCIEYNAQLPPSMACEVPYDAAESWDTTSWYGASLKTLEEIGTGKGLVLVGCDLRGVNALFVDAAEQDQFLPPFTAEYHYEPARFPTLMRHAGHPRSDAARRWLAG